MKNCWVKYNRIQGIHFPRHENNRYFIQLNRSNYLSKDSMFLLWYIKKKKKKKWPDVADDPIFLIVWKWENKCLQRSIIKLY